MTVGDVFSSYLVIFPATLFPFCQSGSHNYNVGVFLTLLRYCEPAWSSGKGARLVSGRTQVRPSASAHFSIPFWIPLVPNAQSIAKDHIRAVLL